ncbi:MAG: hypothetical protein ACOYJC_09750 [Christensenellales bacterium]|jgi:hypothetical protein
MSNTKRDPRRERRMQIILAALFVLIALLLIGYALFRPQREAQTMPEQTEQVGETDSLAHMPQLLSIKDLLSKEVSGIWAGGVLKEWDQDGEPVYAQNSEMMLFTEFEEQGSGNATLFTEDGYSGYGQLSAAVTSQGGLDIQAAYDGTEEYSIQGNVYVMEDRFVILATLNLLREGRHIERTVCFVRVKQWAPGEGWDASSEDFAGLWHAQTMLYANTIELSKDGSARLNLQGAQGTCRLTGTYLYESYLSRITFFVTDELGEEYEDIFDVITLTQDVMILQYHHTEQVVEYVRARSGLE